MEEKYLIKEIIAREIGSQFPSTPSFFSVFQKYQLLQHINFNYINIQYFSSPSTVRVWVARFQLSRISTEKRYYILWYVDTPEPTVRFISYLVPIRKRVYANWLGERLLPHLRNMYGANVIVNTSSYMYENSRTVRNEYSRFQEPIETKIEKKIWPKTFNVANIMANEFKKFCMTDPKFLDGSSSAHTMWSKHSQYLTLKVKYQERQFLQILNEINFDF